MAYDQGLADRIGAVLGDQPHVVSKKMFGGLAYMLHGNMAVGVLGGNLFFRVPPGEYAELLAEPHVRVFDMNGRPSRGWLVVEPDGFATSAALERWIALGVSVAESLPPK